MNVTERVRARKRLEDSEKRFQQTRKLLPQIVWTAQPDGYLDYYNDRWYEFTGFDRERMGDESWQQILHPDDFEKVRESWYGAIKTLEPYQLEIRYKDRHNGDYRWFIVRALPIKDDTGKVVKWFGSSTDIDEQKKNEQELLKARQELHAFLMQAPIGIALMSGPKHVYTLMNPTFRNMCFGGRPESDFLNRTVRDALPELNGQGFTKFWMKCTAPENPSLAPTSGHHASS